MKRVHIWSDRPGDWKSTGWGADSHAEGEPDDLVVNVNSVVELHNYFKEWAQSDTSFDVMDFHTHGAPGVIALGNEELTAWNYKKLYVPNIEKILNKNGQIIFMGCNVAGDYKGEIFLLRFGEMMLKNSGGKVLGSTGLGFGVALFSGEIFHPFGDWVSAEVGTGGGVKLFGNTFLVAKNIGDRITALEEKIRKFETDGWLSHLEALKLMTWLIVARTFVANPTYENMFDACDHLQMVEKKMTRTKVFNMPVNIH